MNSPSSKDERYRSLRTQLLWMDALTVSDIVMSHWICRMATLRACKILSQDSFRFALWSRCIGDSWRRSVGATANRQYRGDGGGEHVNCCGRLAPPSDDCPLRGRLARGLNASRPERQDSRRPEWPCPLAAQRASHVCRQIEGAHRQRTRRRLSVSYSNS